MQKNKSVKLQIIWLAISYFLINMAQDKQCRLETNTFILYVRIKPNKLTIKLKDMVDLMLYEKDYTDYDVGKQIHRKMQLTDIYSSLANKKYIVDNEEKRIYSEPLKIQKYQFGETIKQNNVPCFRIQKGGKIVVYATLKDIRSDKFVCIESALYLDKGREMTDMEKFIEKCYQQKRELQERMIHKIYLLQKQKKKHIDKIQNLQKKVSEIKTESKNQSTKKNKIIFLLIIVVFILIILNVIDKENLGTLI